jgi:hypothetical protein
MMGTKAEHEVVPVWPHERYAAACARKEWADAEATSIPLNDWRTRWLPGLRKGGRWIAVSPTGKDEGAVVTADVLEAALKEALSNYE